MLNSMTGFARAAVETAFGTLTCELRAVNHRYLDVQFRLPDELRSKEIDFRNTIGDELARGKVECSVHLRRSRANAAELNLNTELVQQVGASAARIASLLPDCRAPDSLDVLRWPGVVTDPEIDTEPLYEEAKTALVNALAEMGTMRASEGQRIADMLDSRLDDIAAISMSVRNRMPEVLAAVRAKQQERIDKLDIEADPDRLETELALIAQKLDVDEELDRLESHVSEVRGALKKTEPVGRRLDFLMQELNREANTLGSKSADKQTTNAAVDLKVLIEQMREQIQNVE
ncbi:MAG: YicC/YloC family endoribonuclease [Woeseiaceae bacterium]